MGATLQQQQLLLLAVVVVFSSAVAPQVGSFNLMHAMINSYYCTALISHRSVSHVEGLIEHRHILNNNCTCLPFPFFDLNPLQPAKKKKQRQHLFSVILLLSS
jgi:hypothetical protein